MLSDMEKQEIVEAIENKDVKKEEDKKKRIKNKAKQYLMITLGVLILDFGFYFFLDPAYIVSGGTMGLSIIFTPMIHNFWPWFTNSIFLYIVDVIALICGLIFLGKDFFLKTIYATLLSPTIIFLFERGLNPNFFLQTIEDPTTVKIVAMIIGSLFVGIGVGVAIKNDGSTGGMDVFQKMINKLAKVPMSVAIYFTDWVIVLLAGFVKNAEFTYYYQIASVVFGSIGVFMQAYIIDMICMSGRSRRTVYVITDYPDKIKELIYSELDRGVTFASVVGAYTGIERTMVICTMDKNEAYKITSEVSKLDPHSFTFVSYCKEVKGYYEKRGII
ncbi:MAG: YitT family protein [Acholeplasmatales bacterium]|nr:YitT family protein [Acholeplasmatales bacterium]